MIQRGDMFKRIDDGAKVRVMAVADGWAMVRRPGCAPFVQSVKTLKTYPKWDLVAGIQNHE